MRLDYMNMFFGLLFAILFSQSAASQPVAENASISAAVITKDCDSCPEMVTIPAGSFLRGSETGRSTERPVHKVSVKSFMIGRVEITQKQWRDVMGSNPSANQACGENCPVDSVSWDDVHDFLKRLRELTGKEYRLPSEAEWEYAARGGTSSIYWWGDSASHENANYGTDECCNGLAEGRDQWENTAPVGSFPPNAYGLYDTHGNVAEWVEDVYHKNYFLAPGDGSAWVTGAPHEFLARVVRGGAWNHDKGNLRSASRGMGIIVETSGVIGFRVARSL